MDFNVIYSRQGKSEWSRLCSTIFTFKSASKDFASCQHSVDKKNRRIGGIESVQKLYGLLKSFRLADVPANQNRGPDQQSTFTSGWSVTGLAVTAG